MGDYSVIVHWRTASGEDRSVQTSASGYAKTEGQITSGGGSIYKVTRVGGGRVTPPTATAPAIAEDKVLFETAPPPKPKPKQAEGETPFWYLTTYAETKESEALQKLSTVPYFSPQWQQTPWKTIHQRAVQQAGEKAYRSLTPSEKIEFGIAYTDWEKIAAEERRFYPGGIQHLKTLPISEQEQLGSQFAEEHIRHDPWWHFGSTWRKDGEPIPMAGFRVREYTEKGFTEKQALSKIGWEELSTVDTGAMTYGKMPFHMRTTLSTGQAFSQAVIWPVTLGQTGVKFLTGGKTLLFPDVGGELKKRQVGPSGLISVGISEGIGAATGQESMEWETAQKYPVETGFATVGEVAGFIFGGKVVKGFYAGGKLGVKSSVRAMPKMYGKFESFMGRGPTYLEHGGRLLPKTFGTKIGQTKFYQHLHGWSTGKLVRVKTIPIKTPEKFFEGSRTGVQEGPFTIAGRLTKYRGFGKAEWVPRGIAERYQIGEAVSYSHLYRPDTYRGKIVEGMGTRSQIYDVTFMSKPKGFLWWKRGKIQTSSVREIEHVGTKFYPEILPSKYVGFDRSVSRDFIRWYTTKMNKAADTHFVRMGFDYSVAKESMKGFTWSSLKRSDVGYSSLTGHVPHTQLTYQPMIHGTKAGGYLGQPSISVPASSFSTLSISALGLGYGLSQVDFSAYSQRRDLGKVQQPDYASALKVESAYDVVPVQATDMAQVQKQAYRQKSALLTETVSIPVLSPGRKGASVPYRGLGPGVKVPKIFLVDFDGGNGKKKKKQRGIDWTKGYRERTWKVPTVEDLLPGLKDMKKRMKKFTL